MSEFVESLKRLYENNKLNLEKLNELINTGKITQEEFDYITNNQNRI